ncbi:hypothetical protein CPB85DRAFT_153472, partial [Mucidula mucida]
RRRSSSNHHQSGVPSECQFLRDLVDFALLFSEEIKAAYRRMLLLHHPDKHTGPHTQSIDVTLIKEAYEILSQESREKPMTLNAKGAVF